MVEGQESRMTSHFPISASKSKVESCKGIILCRLAFMYPYKLCEVRGAEKFEILYDSMDLLE